MLRLCGKFCPLTDGISSFDLMKRALDDHRSSVATLREGRS
jgi:hypothetical protein